MVNSRRKWHSSPCQARPTLHELDTWPVRVKGRTKTAPMGRLQAAKSPETHPQAYIERRVRGRGDTETVQPREILPTADARCVLELTLG